MNRATHSFALRGGGVSDASPVLQDVAHGAVCAARHVGRDVQHDSLPPARPPAHPNHCIQHLGGAQSSVVVSVCPHARLDTKAKGNAIHMTTTPAPALLAIGAEPADGVRGYLGGVSRAYIYNLISSGELQSVKLGRRVLITRESADALVARISGRQTSSASSSN